MEKIVEKAKARGVTSSDKSIRTTVYNEKKKLRDAELIAPSAARTTTTPSSQPAASTAPPSVGAAASAPSGSDLTGVFANVAQVSKVVDLCGGLENARDVAEAVRACGSVDACLQHLDLVADIRSNKST